MAGAQDPGGGGVGEIVPLLYKYLSPKKGLELLRSGRLYFTPPEYFNDINEMSPFVCKDFSPEEYHQFLWRKEYLVPIYQSHKTDETYAAFAERARTDSSIINEVHALLCPRCERLQQDFKMIMSKYVGVCCMSTIATSNLMWAHYSNSHRGLCIGLRLEKSHIELIDNLPVQYSDTKVRIPAYLATLPGEQRYAYYSKVAFSKGEEWRYEQEHRLVARKDQCKTERSSCKTRYYQEIDKRDIEEVLLGSRCDLGTTVRDLIKKKAMGTRIIRCIQEEKSYTLGKRLL